jgi:hypothetical protein
MFDYIMIAASVIAILCIILLYRAYRKADRNTVEVQAAYDSVMSSNKGLANKLLEKEKAYSSLEAKYIYIIKDFQAATKQLRTRGDNYKKALDSIIAAGGPNPVAGCKRMVAIAKEARAK